MTDVQNTNEDKSLTESRRALRILLTVMVAGLLSVILYAIQVGGWKGGLTIISVGWLVAGSAALIGGLLGFLFGIPRTLQQDGVAKVGPDDTEQEKDSVVNPRIDYQVNTNLEQISDWLT